jgi:hypothetical protein
MQKTKVLIGVFLLTAMILAACSGQPANNVMDDINNNSSHSDDSNIEDMNNEAHGDSMSDDSMNDSMEEKDDGIMEDKDDGMMEDKDDAMMEDKDNDMAEESGESARFGPAWYDYEFVDPVTGEKFSINQFEGQVLLVETMATWCSNCLKQQEQVKELHQLLGERDDFQSIGISVELDIEPKILGKYVESRGFDWLYGVADQSVQEGIVASLGGQYVNPPATPMFIVDKNGGTHELPLGKIKSADELLSFLEPFFN